MIDLDKLADVVREAGYAATVEDGHLLFKVEGTSYWLETFENDDTYMRLRVSYLMPSGISVEALLNAANEQNRKTKVVKTVVYPLPEDDRIAFSIELFFGDSTIWNSIFERALAALRVTSDEYYLSLAEVAR